MTLDHIAALSRLLGQWADSVRPARRGHVSWPEPAAFSDSATAQAVAEWLEWSRRCIYVAVLEEAVDESPEQAHWRETTQQYADTCTLMLAWQLYWVGAGRRPRSRPVGTEMCRHARGWIRKQASILYTQERAEQRRLAESAHAADR